MMNSLGKIFVFLGIVVVLIGAYNLRNTPGQNGIKFLDDSDIKKKTHECHAKGGYAFRTQEGGKIIAVMCIPIIKLDGDEP